MGLLESIRKISARVEQQRPLMKTEEATKQVSIRPFIEALGYDTSDLVEVEPEYIADARTRGGERVDYAIKQDGRPIILIESKSANTILTENHWRQLHDYFNAEEVRFGILTNGLEYRFFTDLKKRNIMDKQPFMMINMLNLDERTVNELEGFRKSGYDPELILSNAQKLAISQLLSTEFNQPSDDFVKHFAGQVHLGPLSYSQMPQYRQHVQQAWRDLIEQEIARRTQILPKDVSERADTSVEDARTTTALDAPIPPPETHRSETARTKIVSRQSLSSTSIV